LLKKSLAYAVELAEAGSFRRAAEKLNITHAALVHGIRSLEESYGVRLFDRGRGVKAIPTEIGEVFLRRARKILLSQSDLEHDILLLKEPGVGSLHLAIGPFPIHISGMLAIGRLISRYPALQAKLSIRQYKQVMGMVLERQADIGIAELGQSAGYSELVTKSLGHHLAGFFCRSGHPLLRQNHLTIEDLVKFPWCCTRMPSRVSDCLPSDLSRAGRLDPGTRELIPAIEIETMAGVLPLIKESDVLFPSALVMLKEELREGLLAILPFHESWMVTNYGFISLKNRSIPPAVKEFMDEVRRIERELFLEERELVETFLKGNLGLSPVGNNLAAQV
jgi:DNA-binding transcriptional LysR family regulator